MAFRFDRTPPCKGNNTVQMDLERRETMRTLSTALGYATNLDFSFSGSIPIPVPLPVVTIDNEIGPLGFPVHPLALKELKKLAVCEDQPSSSTDGSRHVGNNTGGNQVRRSTQAQNSVTQHELESIASAGVVSQSRQSGDIVSKQNSNVLLVNASKIKTCKNFDRMVASLKDDVCSYLFHTFSRKVTMEMDNMIICTNGGNHIIKSSSSSSQNPEKIAGILAVELPCNLGASCQAYFGRASKSHLGRVDNSVSVVRYVAGYTSCDFHISSEKTGSCVMVLFRLIGETIKVPRLPCRDERFSLLRSVEKQWPDNFVAIHQISSCLNDSGIMEHVEKSEDLKLFIDALDEHGEPLFGLVASNTATSDLYRGFKTPISPKEFRLQMCLSKNMENISYALIRTSTNFSNTDWESTWVAVYPRKHILKYVSYISPTTFQTLLTTNPSSIVSIVGYSFVTKALDTCIAVARTALQVLSNENRFDLILQLTKEVFLPKSRHFLRKLFYGTELKMCCNDTEFLEFMCSYIVDNLGLSATRILDGPNFEDASKLLEFSPLTLATRVCNTLDCAKHTDRTELLLLQIALKFPSELGALIVGMVWPQPLTSHFSLPDEHQEIVFRVATQNESVKQRLTDLMQNTSNFSITDHVTLLERSAKHESFRMVRTESGAQLLKRKSTILQHLEYNDVNSTTTAKDFTNRLRKCFLHEDNPQLSNLFLFTLSQDDSFVKLPLVQDVPAKFVATWVKNMPKVELSKLNEKQMDFVVGKLIGINDVFIPFFQDAPIEWFSVKAITTIYHSYSMRTNLAIVSAGFAILLANALKLKETIVQPNLFQLSKMLVPLLSHPQLEVLVQVVPLEKVPVEIHLSVVNAMAKFAPISAIKTVSLLAKRNCSELSGMDGSSGTGITSIIKDSSMHDVIKCLLSAVALSADTSDPFWKALLESCDTSNMSARVLENWLSNMSSKVMEGIRAKDFLLSFLRKAMTSTKFHELHEQAYLKFCASTGTGDIPTSVNDTGGTIQRRSTNRSDAIPARSMNSNIPYIPKRRSTTRTNSMNKDSTSSKNKRNTSSMNKDSTSSKKKNGATVRRETKSCNTIGSGSKDRSGTTVKRVVSATCTPSTCAPQEVSDDECVLYHVQAHTTIDLTAIDEPIPKKAKSC